MQIRKIGPQPEDNFFIMPNAVIRDRRLSYRARGLMAVITSHETGFHVSSDELAGGGREGIKAVRTAMNELIECNYMRRVRSQDEQGRWRTDIDVYIWGDAPPARMDPVLDTDVDDTTTTDEPFPPVGESGPGVMDRPPTQNGEAVMVHVGEHHIEDHSISPDLVGGGPQSDLTTQVSKDSPTDSPIPSLGIGPLPLVRRRQLMNAGVTETAGPQWELAWTTVTSMEWPEGLEDEARQYPSEHLAQHILQAQERGHPLSPSRWVQFYIEDRQRQIRYAQARLEQEARLAEDPAEREARQNRHLPPDRSREFPPTGTTGVQG